MFTPIYTLDDDRFEPNVQHNTPNEKLGRRHASPTSNLREGRNHNARPSMRNYIGVVNEKKITCVILKFDIVYTAREHVNICMLHLVYGNAACTIRHDSDERCRPR